MNELSKKILRDLATQTEGQRVVDIARRIREPGAAVQVTLGDLVIANLAYRTGSIYRYALTQAGRDHVATEMAEYIQAVSVPPRKAFELRRNDPDRGLIPAGYAHVLEIRDGDNPVHAMGMNQGELIDLWTKIGVYFNLAGMRDDAADTH